MRADQPEPHDSPSPPRTGRADFPHPALTTAVAVGMYRQLHGRASQIHQAQALEVLVVGHPFRRSEGPLAATAHVDREPLTRVGVDRAEGVAGVSDSKIFRPARELSIETLDQLRQRHVTLPARG